MASWQQTWEVLLVVLAAGLVAGKLSEKPRIPDVAAFLLLGIVMGPAVLHWIAEPIQAESNQFILNLGATLIVFDGGRSVQVAVLRRVWISVTMLATVGVLVSALIVGGTIHWLTGESWTLSWLAAAVVASTDPATLMPVFKRVRIRPKLQQTVESESAFNDAVAAALVFTLLNVLQSTGSVSWTTPLLGFAQTAITGVLIGAIIGITTLWLISHKGWGVLHEYSSVVLLTAALAAFQGADWLHGSGLMAAFVAGIITGNGDMFRLPLAHHTEANARHFGNAITLILRMLIFVFLGTQVNFHVVATYWVVAAVAVGVLMVFARPMTVLSSVLVDRRAGWRWRDILFMFWVRETGVIPAALAGMLVARHVPGADMIGAITFFAILATILIQASTTGLVARALGVLVPSREEEV